MKKYTLFYLTLLLLFVISCNGYAQNAKGETSPLFIIWQKNKMGFMDSTGKIVISPIYDWVENFNEGRAIITVNDKKGFIDETGLIIAEPKFDNAMDFHNGHARVQLGLKWGFIDKAGALIIEPKYTIINNFSDGLARVIDDSSKNCYINLKGEIVFKSRFISSDFNEGLALINDKGKMGYMDTTGKIVIVPKFNEAFDFKNGLAKVIIKVDSVGYHPVTYYINKTGKIVNELPSQFFSDGLFFNGNSYIDKSGKVLFYCNLEYTSNEFKEGLVAVRMGFKQGYIDKTGNIKIEPKFEEANGFSQGIASVRVGIKWGYINKNGEMIIKPQFDEVKDFNNGMGYVRLGKKWRYINNVGELSTLRVFFYTEELKEGLTMIHIYDDTVGHLSITDHLNKEGKVTPESKIYYGCAFSDGKVCINLSFDNWKWGEINSDKEIIFDQKHYLEKVYKNDLQCINCYYESYFINKDGKISSNAIKPDFCEELKSIRVGNKYGSSDKTGNIKIKPKYDFEIRFCNDLAAMCIDGKWGYINKSGKIIIKPKFKQAYNFSDGMAWVVKDDYKNSSGYIDKSGEIVIKEKFRYEGNFIDGIAPISINDNMGYADKNGKIIIKPMFFIGEFNEGLANFAFTDKQGGEKHGYIDKNGKIIIKPKFYYAESFRNGLAQVDNGYINKKGKYIWKSAE